MLILSRQLKLKSINIITYNHPIITVESFIYIVAKTERNDYMVWEQKLYEIVRIRGRKLLQSALDNVAVSQMAVVNPGGSGNYTTFDDAVAAALNNTDTWGVNGYFLIHVVIGVYEEYVSIPQNKQYLMMIGDGINQTIITGNRSVVDGWTTFNSATFGKLQPSLLLSLLGLNI